MDPRVVYKFGSVSGLWIKPKLPAAQILANLFGPPWEGTNSCPTPRNPTDCSPLDSSVHGRLQARILQRAAVSCFRASCQPRDLTHVSCTGRRVLYHRATWEAFSAAYINLKMESPCHPTAPLLTMLSGKDENWNSKIHAPSVHSSTIHNSEEMDPGADTDAVENCILTVGKFYSVPVISQ